MMMLSKVEEVDKETLVDQHNIYRCMHGVEEVTWDDELAKKAKSLADKGEYKHSSEEELGEAGENIAWGSPSLNATSVVREWYSEFEYKHSSEEELGEAGENIAW